MKTRRTQRSSVIFFYFFGVCAVVFALTLVWTVVRTLNIKWTLNEGASLDSILSDKVASSLLLIAPNPRDENSRREVLLSRLNGSTSVLFQRRPLVIWSMDYHIGPIQDVKSLLEPLGVHFIDKSLSNNCWRTKTCAKNLRSFQADFGIDPPPEMVKTFQLTYSEDPEMLSVDAFLCFHPAAMCELFMPFNRSMIVVATTRYELGRHSPEQWRKWNDNLLKIHRNPRNVVASNNEYDAKYIEYFTGLRPIVLPSICTYVSAWQYSPTHNNFLLAPIHQKNFSRTFLRDFEDLCQCNHVLRPLREVYAEYSFSDLVKHKGIVHVPYQVSTMSVFEQYAMAIPIIVPSIELLADWHLNHQVIRERTWAGVNEQVPNNSTLAAHESQRHVPDPNCDTDLNAIKYWLRFSDFYTLPHVVQFDSIEDLIRKLSNVDFGEISRKMKEYSVEAKTLVGRQWRTLLTKVALSSQNKPI
ncbi:hypothetical protein CAPTEDRAFT_209626 [Capitella teleta]|uniref:Uncharacterized protein n=1 Tax=Capitella teleta TaxID=283909 RepID=R7T9Z0_CAPTE|nr:hypothetical protein CAPTEDRAFT_209626 [Capitella teleta]|eukprot:ELT90573.1 hypothetical protein CAPTEDRAFT_209626 [Capitella teleta]